MVKRTKHYRSRAPKHAADSDFFTKLRARVAKKRERKERNNSQSVVNLNRPRVSSGKVPPLARFTEELLLQQLNGRIRELKQTSRNLQVR